jgi:hypothetical protein
MNNSKADETLWLHLRAYTIADFAQAGGGGIIGGVKAELWHAPTGGWLGSVAGTC